MNPIPCPRCGLAVNDAQAHPYPNACVTALKSQLAQTNRVLAKLREAIKTLPKPTPAPESTPESDLSAE